MDKKIMLPLLFAAIAAVLGSIATVVTVVIVKDDDESTTVTPVIETLPFADDVVIDGGFDEANCTSHVTLPNGTWTTTLVYPPNSTCCSDGWNDDYCTTTLQNAIDTAADWTILQLQPGTYCNYKWLPTHTSYWHYKRQQIAKIESRSHIFIRGGADNCAEKPLLTFDGSGGFIIKTSEYIYLENMEIQGPSMNITGTEATNNHLTLTGRCEGCCGQYLTESDCEAVQACDWSSDQSYCLGVKYNYYNGQGISTQSSTNQVFSNLYIHHCPSSGIKGDQCDNTDVENCLIYGNAWWTTSATSGLAFSQSQGTGAINFANNVVYANRNYMPFFLISAMPAGGGHSSDVYGTYLQYYIHDGQGLYTTRSQDYEGVLTIKNNLSYDNGINGISIHKTTHNNVQINVVNNTVFENGRTSSEWEIRQNAGGLVVNSGDSSIVASVLLSDNHITAGDTPDRSYQCYGACTLQDGSTNNTYCGGAPASAFVNPQFAETTNCTNMTDYFTTIRNMYPASNLQVCPQWTNFTLADGYSCTSETIGGGANFNSTRLLRANLGLEQEITSIREQLEKESLFMQ